MDKPPAASSEDVDARAYSRYYTEEEMLRQHFSEEERPDLFTREPESPGFTKAKALAKEIRERHRSEAMTKVITMPRSRDAVKAHTRVLGHGQHTRTPGRAPIRFRGSRRSSTALARSGDDRGDPGGGDPEPPSYPGARLVEVFRQGPVRYYRDRRTARKIAKEVF